MSGRDPVPQTQAYEGVRATNPPELVISKGPTARDPGVNDRKYRIGTMWINALNNAVWELTSITANVPVWTLLGAGAGGSGSFVTNSATTAANLTNGRVFLSANAGLTTFTLPLTANVGDTISIIGQGAGFWKIAQNAGQNILFNAAATTVGVTGSITSTQVANTIDLVNTIANTQWTVMNTSGAQAAYTVA